MVREVERGDREIGCRTVSGENEVQFIASFVGRRRRRELKVNGGEEGKKRIQFVSRNVEVAKKDKCRVIKRDKRDECVKLIQKLT